MLFLGREVLLVNKAMWVEPKKHGEGSSEWPTDSCPNRHPMVTGIVTSR
jgi:hypothetical protein